MKLRPLKVLAGLLICLCALGTFPRLAKTAGAASPPVAAADAAPTASPASGKGEGKKKKKDRDPNAPTPTPKIKAPKEIPFPLPLKRDTHDVKIPELSVTGQVLSLIMASKATRIDNEHVQMQEMKMDLNQADGKEDFHIMFPTSVFNLQTHIISSDQPVTVRTQDFELTGEKMEFDTVERSGKLIGKVRMVVHNLKQVAGQQEPTPKPE